MTRDQSAWMALTTAALGRLNARVSDPDIASIFAPADDQDWLICQEIEPEVAAVLIVMRRNSVAGFQNMRDLVLRSIGSAAGV